MLQRFQGTVIWYDAGTGYGIIRLHAYDKTVSIDACQVHHNSRTHIRSLRVGQEVSFEIADTEAHNLYFL